MDDVADLEPLAARLEQSGDYRVLRRVPEVILPLLLENARQRVFRIWALEAPIECKDLLKAARLPLERW